MAEGMKSALESTSSMKSAISRSSSAGAKDLLAALQSTANGDLEDATEQARTLLSAPENPRESAQKMTLYEEDLRIDHGLMLFACVEKLGRIQSHE